MDILAVFSAMLPFREKVICKVVECMLPTVVNALIYLNKLICGKLACADIFPNTNFQSKLCFGEQEIYIYIYQPTNVLVIAKEQLNHKIYLTLAQHSIRLPTKRLCDQQKHHIRASDEYCTKLGARHLIHFSIYSRPTHNSSDIIIYFNNT